MALALKLFGEPDRCIWCQRSVVDQNVGNGNKCQVCARRAYERRQWQQMQARLMKAATLAALDNIAKIEGTVVSTLRHGFHQELKKSEENKGANKKVGLKPKMKPKMKDSPVFNLAKKVLKRSKRKR